MLGVALLAGLVRPAVSSAAGPAPLERVTLVADADDDDADGVPDGEAEKLSPDALVDLVPLDPRLIGTTLGAPSGDGAARVVAGGRVLAEGAVVPRGALLQGVRAGHARIAFVRGADERVLDLDVHGVGFRDGALHDLDLAREHASLARTPPTREDLEGAARAHDDPDALRLVLASGEGTSLGAVTLTSVAADGAILDSIHQVPTAAVPCGTDLAREGVRCFASVPFRFVTDEVDRRHPLTSARSLRAQVLGAVVARDARGRKLAMIRVAGPRNTALGAIEPHVLSVRAVVMRVGRGGGPAVGGTDDGAMLALRQELALASSIWGQCGVTFGGKLDVRVMSPPPPYLVALGDDVGLPASGGTVKLLVEGRAVSFVTKEGWSTKQSALELARALERSGFRAVVSENPRIAPGAAPSVDVAVRTAAGQLATVQLVSTTDASLVVRVGVVELEDGLQHFSDGDSAAGTLEERALVKSVEDGDPSTVDIVVVPFFSGGGRIGESFIGSDGGGVRNVVILDRAGIRARRTSLTLAHELGHVILDDPGHPDDYGIDTPTRLMDSDAADASPFGPRRLTVDECVRAIRQSGPRSRAPLLRPLSLSPLPRAFR